MTLNNYSLLEPGERLRISDMALHALPQPFIIIDAIDPVKPIVYVNPAFEDAIGLPACEILGKNPRFLPGVEANADALKRLDQAAANGQSTRETLKIRTQGHQTAWIEIALTPMMNEAGELTHFCALEYDVSPHHYAEKIIAVRDQIVNLSARGEPLDALLGEIASGAESIEPDLMASILLLNDDGTTLTCRAARSLPSAYVRALNNLPVTDQHCEAAHERATVISENLATDPIWSSYSDVLEESGLRSCWSEPVITADGNAVGIVSFYSAMPSRPSDTQMELLRKSAEISAIVISRAIAQRKLKQIHNDLESRVVAGIAKADAANAAKSRFLNAASHDLRQPLQSIRFYLSALEHSADEAEKASLIHKIDQSAYVMGELLDSLLNLSELENGSIKPRKRDFPIQEFLEKVSSSCSPHADAKGLILTIESSVLAIHSDPVLLQRILENLISNAIRYTDKGSITVRCHCIERSAVLEVIDTGIGIPAEKHEHIFDEYVQIENEERDTKKGLGLGLSIVQQLAKVLDHQVSVCSEPDVGSVFSIHVPIANTPVIDDEQSISEQAAVSDNVSPQVLVIDDNEAILDSMSIMLELNGIDAHCASTGDEALIMMRTGLQPDLVISDYRLRGQTGFEVMQSVRQAAGRTIPGVVMSGDTYGVEPEDAGVANCTLMRKPVDVDLLISLIANVTQSHSI